MKDLKLQRMMDLAIDESNDAATRTGREEFEQQIAIYLNVYLDDAIGKYDTPELRALIRMRIKEVAKDYQLLSTVNSMTIREHSELPNALDITILYQGGETFQTVLG